HGTTRRLNGASVQRFMSLIGEDLASRVRLHQLTDMDKDQVHDLIQRVRPHEVYHLGGQSHVGTSFEQPFETVQSNVVSSLSILDACRELNRSQTVRIYQACSSEMFGAPVTFPQDETTPFHPRSPYGCSKVCSYHLAVNYREAYDLFASNGILFNHESPRRPEAYVTRKITMGVARIMHGLQDKLVLGSLDVGRDWGFAREYVDAMWRMLQQDEPSDYVIASNCWNSLSTFLEAAFEPSGLNWSDYVTTDPSFVRPAEVSRLQGDYSKAESDLGWHPQTQLTDLAKLMVQHDFNLIECAQSDASS
ncbi:MAG: GDP-mannose 4,6-dehydratase, partial [Planctomycetaceae bacterium]